MFIVGGFEVQQNILTIPVSWRAVKYIVLTYQVSHEPVGKDNFIFLYFSIFLVSWFFYLITAVECATESFTSYTFLFFNFFILISYFSTLVDVAETFAILLVSVALLNQSITLTSFIHFFSFVTTTITHKIQWLSLQNHKTSFMYFPSTLRYFIVTVNGHPWMLKI